MPPTIVALPPRAGSMRFTDEDVTAVIDLLRQCETGQAVRLTDSPDDSDNTARRRAELLKEQIGERNSEPIKAGYKIRGHVLTAGEPTVKEHTSKKTGKTYKVTEYPENWGAVSLVPETDPDEPAPDADPPAAGPPAKSPAKPRGGNRD